MDVNRGISLSLQVGEIITFERTFTVEDVELFTKVSGDEGTHHTTPDESFLHLHTNQAIQLAKHWMA